MVSASNADAIGLNFYSSGKRYVSPSTAQSILSALTPTESKLVTVGVFVDHDVQEIINVTAMLGLHVVQLHGDQRPEELISLKSLAHQRDLDCDFIRAIRTQPHDGTTAMDLEEVNSEIKSWVAAGIDAILIDAAVAGNYGGTGKQVDWAGFAALQSTVPKILAGGLNPDNIAQAIEATSPWAVDVASGVERTAGQKDKTKTRNFADFAIARFNQNKA